MLIRIVFLGLMTLVSIFLVRQIMRFFDDKRMSKIINADEPLEVREKRIIQLAAKLGGKVTIPEICMKTSLSVDDAKETLNSLIEKEVLQLQVSASGSKIYSLLDLASDAEKEDLIDLV